MKIKFIAAATLAFSGQALAQSTTCMDMGGGMMTCNTSTPQGNVHTQCMRHGTIIDCNSTGGNQAASQDSGYILGQGLASLFQGISERRFRAKVGEMLAAGDCRGAAAYAFEKGKLEIGQSITRQCQVQSAEQRYAPPQNLPYEELVEMVSVSADAFYAGLKLSEEISVTEAEADGGTLRIGTNISPDSNAATVTQIVCSHAWMRSVLSKGGTIALDYVEPELRITREDCGI